MAEVRTTPGCLCLRLIPWPQNGDLERMRAGEFEPLFAAAERHGVPIFVGMPGQAPLIEPYLQRFPRLPVILDHCGVGVAVPPGGEVPPMLGEREVVAARPLGAGGPGLGGPSASLTRS